MNKQELLDIIQDLPDDATFLVSSDEEGNSIRSLGGLDHSLGLKFDWEWELIHPDDAEEYGASELVPVVVFW